MRFDRTVIGLLTTELMSIDMGCSCTSGSTLMRNACGSTSMGVVIVQPRLWSDLLGTDEQSTRTQDPSVTFYFVFRVETHKTEVVRKGR